MIDLIRLKSLKVFYSDEYLREYKAFRRLWEKNRMCDCPIPDDLPNCDCFVKAVNKKLKLLDYKIWGLEMVIFKKEIMWWFCVELEVMKMEDKYFKELYECKKELLNELLVIKKIIGVLDYSKAAVTDLGDARIKELKEEMEAMEVDLKE